MDFSIEQIKELSGQEGNVYSVRIDGEENTLLEQFFNEYYHSHHAIVTHIYEKLHTMSNDTGFRNHFFKEGEGGIDEGVIALKGTGRLRLYGIYFHRGIILLGDGGYKPPHARSWQDVPALRKRVERMRAIAQDVNRMIREKTLIITNNTIELWK